jgi:dynein heavy chain
VPNLFAKDELGGVLDEVRPAAKAAGAGDTLEQVSGLVAWGCCGCAAVSS